MHTSFFSHIRRFVSLTTEEESIVLHHVRFEKINGKGFLLTPGNVCAANYFVVDGCFRMYLTADSGTEQILQFGISNWWITDYTSFEGQIPSQFAIQALEPSTVVCLEKKNREELLRKIPQLERYFRMVVQRAYSATLMRLHFIFNFSGEERYRQFVTLYPDFVQRIPQYMLASYLGFTPEFLSKIRAKKN
jgi:CRP-like cAMP-binding protein